MVVRQLGRFIHIDDLVAGKSEITSYVKGESLAETFVVSGIQIDTPVDNLTQVDVRQDQPGVARGGGAGRDEYTGTHGPEDVDIQSKRLVDTLSFDAVAATRFTFPTDLAFSRST